jgi:hypothetical protein
MVTGSLPFSASDPMEWVHCHIARKPAAFYGSGAKLQFLRLKPSERNPSVGCSPTIPSVATAKPSNSKRCFWSGSIAEPPPPSEVPDACATGQTFFATVLVECPIRGEFHQIGELRHSRSLLSGGLSPRPIACRAGRRLSLQVSV